MPTLYLLIGLTILNQSVYVGSRVAVVLYAIHLGAPTVVVGVLASVFGLLPMLLSVWTGRLTDRVRPRNLLLTGTVAVAIGAALPALFPAIWALYLAGILVGSGFMLFTLTVQNVAGHIGKPEDRASNFSLLSIGFSAASLMGPLLAGFAIDSLGHRAAFAVLAALPVPPLLVFALDKIRLPQPPRARDADSGGGRVRALLAIPVLRRVLVVNGLIALAWDLYSFVIPVHGAAIGLPATVIGLVMACFSAATFVIRIVLTPVMLRLNSWRVMSFVLLFAAAVYCLFPLFPNAIWLAFLSMLLGLCLGATQPLVMALLHNHSPAGQVGTVVGMRSGIIYASQTFIPVVFGALGSALGMIPVFFVVAACLLAGGMMENRIQARSGHKS